MATEATDQAIEAVRGIGGAVTIVRGVFADGRVDFSDATLVMQSTEELAEIQRGVEGASEAASEIRSAIADRNFDALAEIGEALADELEQQGVDVPLYEVQAS